VTGEMLDADDSERSLMFQVSPSIRSIAYAWLKTISDVVNERH